MTKRYEVRVEGELGETLLQYLTWSHRLIPEGTRMQIQATPTELEQLLRAIFDEGLTVERVHQVPGPVRAGCYTRNR